MTGESRANWLTTVQLIQWFAKGKRVLNTPLAGELYRYILKEDEMGELLYKKWLEEEVLDLQEAILHHGIEGLLGEFERWLEVNKYLVEKI